MTPTEPPRPSSPLPFAGALAAAAAAVYANSFRVPFLFDDPLATVENPSLRRWSTALSPPHGKGITVEGRPFLNLTFAANWHLTGSAVWSYHALNLLIHIAAAWALFGVLRRTLPCAGADSARSATWLAFVIALLWAVHPLQTESVTYIAQRAESLMGFFYLLTLYAFIRHADSPAGTAGRFRWGALAFGACLLGAWTKEVMITAPYVTLLYDRTFRSGSWREVWRRHGWLHGALLATALPLLAQVAATGSRGHTSGFDLGITVAYYLTQFHSIVRYLGLCFWPRPLIFDYGTQWVYGAAGVFPYAVGVAGLAALTTAGLSRWSPAGFCGFFFFAILSVTSLVPGNRQTSAEHRMYLPLAAVLAFAIVGGYRLAAARRSRYLVCVGALAIPLGAVAAARNRIYSSAVKFYWDSVVKVPDNAFAQYNLGKILDETGHPAAAIPQYEESLRLDPRQAFGWENLGNSYKEVGQTDQAESAYLSALRLNPNLAQTRYNLGLLYLKSGRTDAAREQFNDAVLLDPNYAEARDCLGGIMMDSGELDPAREQFEYVVRIGAATAVTRYNLGMVDLVQSRPDDARTEFLAALRLDPTLEAARERLKQLDVR